MAASAKTRVRSAEKPETPDTDVDEVTAPPAVVTTAAPGPKTPEPLVDLDDDDGDHRDTVRHEGKLYELKAINEFGIGKQHSLTRDGREFFRLWSSEDELSETDEQRLEMLLNRMLEAVMLAPATVKKKMSDGKKSRVVLAFTLAPVARRMAQAQGQEVAAEAETA